MKRVKNLTTYHPTSGRVVRKSITIKIINRPPAHTLNDELQWFAKSLGLFTLRDKDSTCFRVFIELLKAAKLSRPISSDELAYRLGLSRGTVMHHVNKLLATGLVTTQNRAYMLREPSLPQLLESIRRDFDKAYEELYTVAEEIDKTLGQ